jgi:hypothetical protein
MDLAEKLERAVELFGRHPFCRAEWCPFGVESLVACRELGAVQEVAYEEPKLCHGRCSRSTFG